VAARRRTGAIRAVPQQRRRSFRRRTPAHVAAFYAGFGAQKAQKIVSFSLY